MRTTARYASILTLTLGAACCPAAAASGENQLRATIERVRAVAERIVVDGKDEDWQGIPVFTGWAGDNSDPSRRITSVAIAAREEDLLVLIRTEGKPSRQDRAFWINVDYTGTQVEDFKVGFARRGTHVLRVYPPGEPAVESPFAPLQFAVGDVVEIRISYAALGPALPLIMREALTGPAARSWVRVAPATWNVRTQQSVGYGAAVAGYRLTNGTLDPPLPRPSRAARAVTMPLAGRWFVGQGAFGEWTHKDVWAYDLWRVNAALLPASEPHSRTLSQYFSWGEPIFAPGDGKIIRAQSSFADNAPLDPEASTDAPNDVYLDLGNNIGCWLVHFKRNSTIVQRGDIVRQGGYLGSVGHSGSKTWPHLHIGLYRLPEGKQTLPMALSRVRVSLNPDSLDPWTRDLDYWDIREGFFVERLEDQRNKSSLAP